MGEAETSNPTVKEMIRGKLQMLGFDGLFSNEIDCACDLDDLMPCDEPCPSCEAGYKTKTPPPDAEDFSLSYEAEEAYRYICRRKHD